MMILIILSTKCTHSHEGLETLGRCFNLNLKPFHADDPVTSRSQTTMLLIYTGCTYAGRQDSFQRISKVTSKIASVVDVVERHVWKVVGATFIYVTATILLSADLVI